VFAAAAGSVPNTGAQSGASTASATKPHRIDIHHHVAPPKYIEEMRALLQPPTLGWTPERTLADMDGRRERDHVDHHAWV
jgi:hypothetical protein